MVHDFATRGVPHEVAALRCGHYSIGKTPFKFVDGWVLTRFLKRALLTGREGQDGREGWNSET
jgi:hypothetical protein